MIMASKMANNKLLLLVTKLSGLKAKDRVYLWRLANELGITSMIRSVFVLNDGKEGRLRAERFTKLIEEKGGNAWLFSAESYSQEDRRSIEKIIKLKRESEINEFIEECEEFMSDISNELREQEFEFYELEELSVDLYKLEKWKTKLMQKFPSDKRLYDRLEEKLKSCRKLMTTFEKKCMENVES
jgi:hypothetical protein